MVNGDQTAKTSLNYKNIYNLHQTRERQIIPRRGCRPFPQVGGAAHLAPVCLLLERDLIHYYIVKIVRYGANKFTFG